MGTHALKAHVAGLIAILTALGTDLAPDGVLSAYGIVGAVTAGLVAWQATYWVNNGPNPRP